MAYGDADWTSEPRPRPRDGSSFWYLAPMLMLHDADISSEPLVGKQVAVIGFGSQGRAQALCLRDSGVDVHVGVRYGPSRERAEADGLPVAEIAEAAAKADLIALLVPERAHREVFAAVGPSLRPGATLVFAHGFSLLYDVVQPPSEVDVVLVAPMGAGPTMRELYEQGSGVAGLVAVHRDATGSARAAALAYAKALGCGRVGVMESSVREETETDLFGEQAVLCGGLTALMLAGFETLVEAGYPEEIAYFECIHQVKLLADLVHEHGIAGMRERISDTALYGDLTRGPRVVGEASRAAMRELLREIRSGAFAREWLAEQESGLPNLQKLRDQAAQHPAEGVSRKLRR
ncbi:MAG: ketol-acid reductoisomerase (NADP(+)) [Fimbriimonadales bacterium]